jgi:hypothetical protein
VRPKTIVYFEWIMLGLILLSALRTYLYDPNIRQIAANPVFEFVTFDENDDQNCNIDRLCLAGNDPSDGLRSDLCARACVSAPDGD